MADKDEEVQDTSDYKLSKSGRKIRAHRVIFNKGIDDGKKGISEMKKSYKDFVEQHTAELTEEQNNELIAELQEVLGKGAEAGEWISDFVHSDNPKFAGKSKEKRKQMALAAYYAKQRNEEVELDEVAVWNPIKHIPKENQNAAIKTAAKDVKRGSYADRAALLKAGGVKKEEAEIEEELKGKQHKLDKNKNGKLDAHDFKLLRKEDAEQVDEAESHQAKTTMKHVKNPTPDEKKAAKDIKPGIAGYRDRVAMLKSAEARGALKKEEAEHIDEAIDANDYTATSEKSNVTGGHRPHVVNKSTGKTMHLSQHSYKSPEHAKAHAKAYLSGYAKLGPNAADRAAHEFYTSNKDKLVKESVFDWKNKPRQTSDTTTTKTYHDVKKISTGTVYTKQFDKDGVSKGTGDDAAKKAEGAAKRGRGRPKKDKFAEAVDFLLGLSEEHFDDMMEEGFDAFIESYDQLDELSKTTLGSYIKRATNKMPSGLAMNAHQAGDAPAGSKERKGFLAKANKRIGGIAKAADRLTK